MTTEAEAAVSCQEIESAFILNECYINPQIQKRREENYRRLWVDLIPATTFKDGEGLIMRKEFFHGDLPSQAEDKWNVVEHFRPEGDPGGANNPCACPEETVRWGFEEKNWTLYCYAFRTPDICLQEVRRQWQFRQQMNLIYDHLAQITLGEQEQFNRDQYWKHHSVNYLAVDDLFATGVTGGVPNPVPRLNDMRPLRQGHLDRIYQSLLRDNFGYGVGMTDGMPDFGLVTSPETSDEIIHLDGKVLQDFRESSRVDSLLAGYGAQRTYRHFMHLHDIHAPRFQLDGAGGISRVYPWIQAATTIGQRVDLNPDYVDPNVAMFELSIILFKPGSVLSMGKVPPLTSVGGATNFDPNSYFGEWKWFNIQDNCNNKWREVGHYANRMYNAPEPGPIQGVGILHLRCAGFPIEVCPEDRVDVGDPIIESAVVDCAAGPTANELEITVEAVLTRQDGTALQNGDAIRVTYNDTTTVDITVSDVSGNILPDPVTLVLDFGVAADCTDNTGLASVTVLT